MAEKMADGRIADYNYNLRKIGMAGGMAEWQKEWQNGRMAGMATYVLFMVHAADDTLIFYSIDVLDNLCYFSGKILFLRKILFSKFTLLEMTFITVLYSNSYYCLRNILLLKFTLLGITLIIVLAHQSYMGARGSCRYCFCLVMFMDKGYCFGDVNEQVYFSDVNKLSE